MKLRLHSLAYWGIALAVIVSENFLYLINTDMSVAGIPVLDIGLMLVFIWILLFLHRYGLLKSINYRFKWIIICALILIFTSSLQSRILYGQSFMLGIRPQRFFFVWCIMYFPIRSLVVEGEVTIKDIEGLIYKIGIIELILYIGQFLLGNSVAIIHAKSNNVYSSTRYYMSTILLCLLLFICLDRIFQKRKVITNIIIIAAVIFEIIVVGKMRLNFISVCAAIVVGIFLWRRGGTTKITFIIVAAIATFFMAGSEVVQSIVPSIQGNTAIDTLKVRQIGRAFYLSVLKNHPFLGGGYINTQWMPAYRAARLSEGIYWVDNGIFGFAYFYGGLGFCWVLWLFEKIYKYAYTLFKNHNIYLFFVMPIYWIVACVNEVHWYFSSFFVMVLFLNLLEGYLDEIDKNVNNEI